jgi:hypothetical protein
LLGVFATDLEQCSRGHPVPFGTPDTCIMSDRPATQADHKKVNRILGRPWTRVFRDEDGYRIEIWNAPKGKSERYTGVTLDEAIEKAKAGDADD